MDEDIKKHINIRNIFSYHVNQIWFSNILGIHDHPSFTVHQQETCLQIMNIEYQ